MTAVTESRAASWPDPEHAYRALSARDSRFDGWFIVAVRTTGIYCRPSCPATTPRKHNVEFFPTSAAAQTAGYRACRRCQPDAVPGSPEWNLRADLAGRAMRLIADGVIERDGVAGLASRLGYSERHLTRVLTTELGAGPLALARAHRAHGARLLIETTGLPLGDVAFAAGFASVRQFNDTIRAVFGCTPSELRVAARRRSPRSAADGGQVAGSLTLRLAFRAPFDAAGVLAFLAARSVPGVESAQPGSAAWPGAAAEPGAPAQLGTAAGPGSGAGSAAEPGTAGEPRTAVGSGAESGSRAQPETATEPRTAAQPRSAAQAGTAAGVGSYARTLRLPHGVGTATLTPGESHVVCALRLTDVRDLGSAVARLRRLLDLDADPAAVGEVLGSDPGLAPSVRAVPGIRVPGSVDGAEIVLRALLGQQITVVAARTALARLTVELGEPLAAPDGPLTTLFPTPAVIAERGGELLRGPRRRIDTIRRVSAALADGSLVVDVGRDAEELRADLLAQPGIGPWTAGYVLMRVLGAPDELLLADVAQRRGATALGLPGDQAELAARAEAWRPWRSYAGMHLWRAAAAREG